MGFKENLLAKITIDQLALAVIRSLKRPDSGINYDKKRMQELLAMSPYTLVQERDLDLYVRKGDEDADQDPKQIILVLDNGMAIYHSTIDDVAMRKSPTVKEMLNIRNAIKIINDKDVVLSKTDESVRTVQTESIALLDLTYTRSDIERLEQDGVDALDNAYQEGVKECAALFAEILGFEPAPKPFKAAHHKIWGKKDQKGNGEVVMGSILIHNMMNNALKLWDADVGAEDKEKLTLFKQILAGTATATIEGPEVFAHLTEMVMQLPPPMQVRS
jgi:hypothetical protein